MRVPSLNRAVIGPLSSAIITVLVAGLVVAGVDSVEHNKVAPGTARLEPDGVVEIALAGTPFVRASHGRTLRARDKVRVVAGGAVLELPRSKVELRAGSVVTINGGAEPALTLDDGDLLVEAGEGETVTVDGGTAMVAVAGSAKVRRGVSLAAGVYDGAARLARHEEELTIPRYRQAAVVGTGILPPVAEPLSLSQSDEWDRRLAGSVVALDDQLMLISGALEDGAPPGSGPEQFMGWMPKGASLPVTPELLAGRPVVENLIGLTLVALDNGDFDSRVAAIFGFRAEGASWGLVTADRGINPNPVISDLEVALSRLHPPAVPGELALPPAGRRPSIRFPGVVLPGPGGFTPRGDSPPVRAGVGAGGAGASPGGNGPGGNGPGGNVGGGSPGGGNPGGGNPGGPGSPKLIDLPPTGTFLDPILDPLLTPVEDLLSGLLGGLLKQGPPATGSLTAGSTNPAGPSSPAGQQPAKAPGPESGGAASVSTGTAGAGAGATTPRPAVPNSGSGPTSPGLPGILPLTQPVTTTTTRPSVPEAKPQPSSGLLGGIVGGLITTVGGLL